MPHSPHVHKPKAHSPKKPKEHSSAKTVSNAKRTILFQSVGGMSNASTRYICYENARYLRNYGYKIKIGKADTGNFDIVVFQKRYNGLFFSVPWGRLAKSRPVGITVLATPR